MSEAFELGDEALGWRSGSRLVKKSPHSWGVAAL
jgi:hypothetical protein